MKFILAAIFALALSGCITDDSYDAGGGFTDPFKQSQGGSRLQYKSDPVSDVMAGGFGG